MLLSCSFIYVCSVVWLQEQAGDLNALSSAGNVLQTTQSITLSSKAAFQPSHASGLVQMTVCYRAFSAKCTALPQRGAPELEATSRNSGRLKQGEANKG